MNKQELKAISKIAEKLNWQNKPVAEVCETIKQMVKNQQALELDTIGECDDEEDTLLSMALWNSEKLISTMYVSSYQDLVMWGVCTFCDDMHINPEDFSAMLTWHSIKYNFLVPEYEAEEEFARWDAEFNDMNYKDFQYGVYMGWY